MGDYRPRFLDQRFGKRAQRACWRRRRDDCSICRLEYRKRKPHWIIAIYKYSTDRYDPEECFFFGSDLVDGTIEGALKARMEAYP